MGKIAVSFREGICEKMMGLDLHLVAVQVTFYDLGTSWVSFYSLSPFEFSGISHGAHLCTLWTDMEPTKSLTFSCSGSDAIQLRANGCPGSRYFSPGGVTSIKGGSLLISRASCVIVCIWCHGFD